LILEGLFTKLKKSFMQFYLQRLVIEMKVDSHEIYKLHHVLAGRDRLFRASEAAGFKVPLLLNLRQRRA
jgi:hypothetical protein